MSIGSYMVAAIFAVIIAWAVWGGHVDLAFIGRLLKVFLLAILSLLFAAIGLMFFSLFGSELMALIGFVAGIVAGVTSPIWWKKFHWKGRLTLVAVVTGVFLLLCGAYLTPFLI